ncbi:MAG: hypothetical protein JO306_14625, partial [Gemmatimonadetes bacterium]|nr:hypothetical protein [Gemmatimonadota bacterium]
MHRLLRLIAAAAMALLPALLATPGRAAAQAGYQCIECDTLPPSVTITPGPITATSTSSMNVTVEFRDPSALQATTRSFVLDSTTDLTSSFSYAVVSGGAVSSGTLTLTPGRHTFTAAITDLTGLTGHRTVVYTYTVPAPPVPRPPAVTPDLAPVQRTQNEPVTERFLLTNPG